MLSANAAQHGRTPAGTTTSVSFKGQIVSLSTMNPQLVHQMMMPVTYDDASDVTAIFSQDNQEAINSLNFEEYVEQCLVHINLHSILQPDDNLPPDPTVTYKGSKSILPKDPDFFKP
jgi:hypothetical protein